MSPAAVEFIFPPQSKQVLTPKNPNHQLPSTFGASSINNPSEQHRSLFPNAADSGFACGLASPSIDSTFSSRSKLRLVKRRHLGFQRGKCSTSTLPRKGSGFNSNQANNACNGNTSNGFRSSIDDFRHGKLNTAGFVFGASSLLSNFNVEIKQKYSDGVGRFNDAGFVFGANRSICVSNSNSEDKESSNDGGKLTACEFGKLENVGSLFGDHRSSSNRSSLMSNLNIENTHSSGMGQTSNGGFVFGLYESNSDSDHNESCMVQYDANESEESKNVGLLFGNNASCSLLHLNLKNGQCGESKGKSGDKVEFLFGANNSCSITNSDSEMRQFGAYEFALCGHHGNLMRNSKSEERESDENVVKLASDEKGRMDLDFREVDDLDFVCHDYGSELRINLNSVKIESAENGGKPVPIYSQKAKAGGKFDKVDFVFGACPEASSTISDLEKSEPSQSAGNLSFEDSGKMKLHVEVETQKEEAHDVFILGSSSKKNLSFSANIDQMNKMSPENVGNDTGFVDTYFDKLDFLINSKSKILSGSNVNATVSSETSKFNKLSEDMRKMNVGDCENTGCSYGTKDPNMDSSASSNPAFVFGNNKSSPGFCTTKSGTTFCDQFKNGGNGGTVERTTRFNFRIIEEDALVFASSNNAACSSDEGAQHVIPNGKNQRISSGLGVSDEQIKLGCHFHECLWEEKQPTNANDNSFNAPPVGYPSIFQTGLGERPQYQLNDHPKLNITSNKALFPSIGLDSEELSMGRLNNEDNLRFTSTPLGERGALKDFRTPNDHTSCAFMVNLSSGLNKKFESSGKSRSHRDKRWKTTRGKLTRAFPESRHNHVSKQDSQQNMKSPRSYSPMDFSPYQDNNCPPSTSNVTSSPCGKNEVLEAASEGANISKDDKKCESNEEDLCNPNKGVVDSSLEETQTDCSNSNMKREETECKKQDQFGFSSRAKDAGEGNFTFSASCIQDKSPLIKRQSQKKYRMKVGHAPSCTTPSQKVDATSSSVQFPVQPHDKERNLNFPESRYKGNKERDKQGSNAPTEKACQKWRIRGNQAYEKGYMSKAEELYTKGINSVPCSEASGCCIEPLVLCYSNRAAARMSLGRIREALGDCMQAAALDPNFLKVQIRAANCHLAMGEVEVALQYFSKCLESGAEVCLDRRITIEASNGLQKAQKVAKCVNQCAELIQQRTCYAAISALEVISGVLSLSSYSEKLLEVKGEALLMLRRYEEVIQLCEQTLVFAEKNVATVAGDNNLGMVDGPTYNNSSIRLWRWHLMAKSYFHLGRLEVALDLLEKQELLRSSEDRRGSNIQESSIPFAVTVRELSHHKNAGNEAFQSGRHTEAVEHYTFAISISIESRPFAAICFCNRAAAHQALGQISDAIADCSLATALDGSYSKAMSRRATLHEKIRDYEQAACDLQILISLLEKQSQEELTQARRSHYSMEEKAKKGMPLDHYLILGIKQSDTASEIKKAYRKAALRHHPDKAAQFLARSESGDDGKQWKEIADEVHKDADRLFKMIGEAYAVLSDPTKRSQYDLQEELRKEQERNGSRGFRGSTEFYSSPSRTTANGRYRQGPWKTSGYSYNHQC